MLECFNAMSDAAVQVCVRASAANGLPDCYLLVIESLNLLVWSGRPRVARSGKVKRNRAVVVGTNHHRPFCTFLLSLTKISAKRPVPGRMTTQTQELLFEQAITE